LNLQANADGDGVVDFWIFMLDFRSITTEFGLSKEFQDQREKGVFLYFHVFLCRTQFVGGLKKLKSH
jgi:hypothetical protein